MMESTDLIRLVLKRLPVKLLIQCQCVCKRWKNIIKSRSFCEEHFRHHHPSLQNLSIFLGQDSLRLCLLDCEPQVREVLKFDYYFRNLARIVGSCNGLLCVEIDSGVLPPPSLLLWNPANREVRCVPDDNDDVIDGDSDDDSLTGSNPTASDEDGKDSEDSDGDSLTGFNPIASDASDEDGKDSDKDCDDDIVTGFNPTASDASDEDGKDIEDSDKECDGDNDDVLIILRNCTRKYKGFDLVTGFGFNANASSGKKKKKNTAVSDVGDYMIVRSYVEYFGVVCRVEVFSVNNWSWEEIDIGDLKRVELYSETVTANGAIFWTGLKLGAEEEGEDNTEVKVIVSFDIANKVFTLIPWPHLDDRVFEKLAVYENKLALLGNIWTDNNGTSDLIDLWVLDEFICASGETWSWTRRYTGSPFPCEIDSLTIWNNEIVCEPEYDENGRNVLYMMNLTTNEVKSFVIPYCGPIRSICNYRESLVSVENNYVAESSS